MTISGNADDVFFGRIAIREGMASEKDIDACMQEIGDLRKAGKDVHLGALMVHRGLLSREQVTGILQRQNKQVLRCPKCAKTYTVMGLPAGKTMACRDCQTPLRRTDADVLTRSQAEHSPSTSGLLDAESQLAPIPDALKPAKTTELGATLVEAHSDTDGSLARTAIGSAESSDPLVGATLSGKYKMLEKIGQGGMGAVYKARHTLLDRLSAVKILPQEMASDTNLVKRLRQEAKVCAQLEQTKNVVQIYDVDNDQGYEYLAMEFIDGQDLESLVQARRRLPIKQAIGIVRQTARGLSAAHDAGIVHRDIKPANVMLTRQGVVKVMDFGLSRLIEGSSHLSRTGQILGTPHYMSPEQARGEPADLRSDIYSLGATLYFMLTGQTPFSASTPTALLLKTISEEPPTANEVNRSVPAGLADIICKMMSKDPEKRYPNLGSCIEDFERLQRGEQVQAHRPPLSLSRLSTLPPRVRRTWSIAGVCLALLLIVAGAFALGRSGGGPEETQRGTEQNTDTQPENPEELNFYLKVRDVLEGDRGAVSAKIHACQTYLNSYGSSARAEEIHQQMQCYERLANLQKKLQPLIEKQNFQRAIELVKQYTKDNANSDLPHEATGLMAHLERESDIWKLLRRAQQAAEENNLSDAEDCLRQLARESGKLSKQQQEKITSLRMVVDLLKSKQSSADTPHKGRRTASSDKILPPDLVRQVNMAWQKENNRRGNPPSVFEPDPYLATLSSLDGWVVAQGSWDTSKRTAGAVGQGVLLLTHGRAKQPVVTTNWQVPPRIRQPGAAFGVLMSILLPRRNKSAHLAFGVQLQPAQLFIRDLTRKEWLAVEPFELPISGGERLLLTASMEQGEFRIELQLAGHDPVVAARHRGRLRGLIPEVYLGAWSFGAQMELRTIKIKQTSTTRRNR